MYKKNLSFVKHYPQRNRDDFLKELQALKDNVLPPPKKANQDILLHQQKRDIQLPILRRQVILQKVATKGSIPTIHTRTGVKAKVIVAILIQVRTLYLYHYLQTQVQLRKDISL